MGVLVAGRVKGPAQIRGSAVVMLTFVRNMVSACEREKASQGLKCSHVGF